ncbi:MAG: hypothetical protein JW915_05205 [Chitinispirillaceae bacterium]|nr:hypothetical protein [Chitinispirillaceae bacterium]
MRKIVTFFIYLFLLQLLILMVSCGGGMGTDSSNADDIGNEIFGSDSTK